MRCFVHQDREAVGICRACLKGLCDDCAIDLGSGLACAEHKSRVEKGIAAADNTFKAQEKAPRNIFIYSLFMILVGIIFSGLWLIDRSDPASRIFLALGVLFAIYGAINFLRNRKVYQMSPRDN